MFPYQDENDENMPAYYRLYVKDRTNFRVGPVRLRQLRINSGECETLFVRHKTENKYIILDLHIRMWQI